ncbi:hypothetical protein [Lentzea sp.]|uniref:hypothetical protein n=1 Tax=Lentzea sp. TaxID=56099 RepID=UPI002ED4D09D
MIGNLRWLARLFVVVLTAGLVQSGGATASAAPGPCLDNGVVGYVTGGPANAYLPSATGSYRTTNRCQDINFSNRSASGEQTLQVLIRVCFVSAGYCQSSWKYYRDSGWIVVASDVKDGTTFRLEFQFYESTYGSSYGNLIAF